MDIDNISDIEVLRRAARVGRLKLKCDLTADDAIEYSIVFNNVFRKGHYYPYICEDNEITIFSDDGLDYLTFSEEDYEYYFMSALEINSETIKE